jgi:uncharacterized iron-regulated protein
VLGLHHRDRAAGDGQHRRDLSFGAATRRQCLAASAASTALALLGASGCAVPVLQAPFDWESKLRGDALVLLGEVHDNAALHLRRWTVLRRALAAGWRPAVAMEQFDVDRQADIERARRERPGDVEHLIAQAGRGGWDWAHYRPLIGLALAHALPLIAADLPDAAARRLVRENAAAVLGAMRAGELGLAGPRALPIDDAWRAAQQGEIARGHCDALPAALLPGMARAQFARDAVMADALGRHAARGAVLLAGNGHVRRDIGVPRWLAALAPARLWTVGFLERGAADDALSRAFDAVVVGAAEPREDPCAAVRLPR